MTDLQTNASLPPDDAYAELLDEARASIGQARSHAQRAVNTELLRSYYRVGTAINARRLVEDSGKGRAGTKLMQRLSADLSAAFPDMTGLSVQNLRQMARFAALYSTETFLEGPAGRVPWGHHIDLIGRVAEPEARQWYLERAEDWTRKQLQAFIAADLHRSQGAAPSNFDRALHPAQADKAQSITRDPLLLDFIAGSDVARERDLELALLAEIERFMLALGKGFFFAGRQVSFVVGDREFIVDLLFYHHGQRRFVVLELKIGEFDPEFAGKLNLYVNAVDEQLAQEHDNPTIGIVLCATRDESVTQLTLKGITSPIAVSTYQLGKGTTSTDLPDGLRQDLDEIKGVEVDLQTFASRRIRELEKVSEKPDTPAS